MSKRGFNKDELRKIITTAIDKDGFHDRSVEYTDKYPFGIPVAKVKIVNPRSSDSSVVIPVVDDARGMMAMRQTIPAKGSYTFDNVPMSCTLGSGSFSADILFGRISNFTITGDAEIDTTIGIGGSIVVHGDCEISFPAAEPQPT